jgi:hypothetical protein
VGVFLMILVKMSTVAAGPTEALSNIKSLFNEGDALTKREVLGLIFHEKLRFNRNEYRTPRLNEAAQLVYQINRKYVQIKAGKKLLLQLFPVQYRVRDSNPYHHRERVVS